MKNSLVSGAKKYLHSSLRKAFSMFPQGTRFAIYRSFVQCDPAPDPRLELKIAQTREELEACFRLLHDAYVGAGFMKPDPSGMRATIYHALPTTTTLCAKVDGQVVGTLSLIRESLLGFPLQAIFDLNEVRAQGGQIAEVSALAVHPGFRKTGGAILFPLMKFMYEYCTTYFDTRHLVIAVNPNRIEMYESLLFFQRLTEKTVANYDFANGAPAVGASLDLASAPDTLAHHYGGKPARKNLHHYFTQLRLANIQLPQRRYFTTNDPVMTPELLDYFFNQQTQAFDKLDEREKILLHAIYNLPTYQRVLPALATPSTTTPDTATTQEQEPTQTLRQHQRYSVKCPGNFVVKLLGKSAAYHLQVIDLSQAGFLAQTDEQVPISEWGNATIQLGNAEQSTIQAMAVRGKQGTSQHVFYGFTLASPDLAWRKFVGALSQGSTHEDMAHASQFLIADNPKP